MLRASLAAAVLLTGPPTCVQLPATMPPQPPARLSPQPPARLPPQPPARLAPQPPARLPPQPPAPLPPLPVTETDPGAAAATLDSPRRMSLTFAEPRPIEEVLRLLVAGTPVSLAVDPDVGGTFRGEIKNLTLRESFATVLAPLGLDFDVEGTVIRVTRHRMTTRQFPVEMIAAERVLRRVTGTRAGGATMTSTDGGDAFAGIEDGVRTLLSESGRAHLDRRAGLATVTDFPERLDRVALYLETLNARSSREVRVETDVIEVTLTDAPSIDWRAVRARLGMPADAPIGGWSADPAALRAALAAQGGIRTLWTPEVTTINNEAALVRVTTPGATSLMLTVVPQISSDGTIQLTVAHTWEEHAGDRREGVLKSTPISRVAESDTVTRVASGSAVLLSGLLRSVQVPKPATGAAALFGAQPKKSAVAELVVLVRPTIVTTGTRD